jgi:hypothetical protein
MIQKVGGLNGDHAFCKVGGLKGDQAFCKVGGLNGDHAFCIFEHSKSKLSAL